MALVKEGDSRRIEVNDGWVDVRAALSIGDLLAMANGDLGALANPTPEILRSMLRVAVMAWSYDEPVSPANVDRLDIQTAAQVAAALNDIFWGDRKKEPISDGNSLEDAGRQNSST